MSLKTFAERELCLNMAGEASFQSGIPQRVLELVEVFRSHGHSGGSAVCTIGALNAIGWEKARSGKATHPDKEVQEVMDLFSNQNHTRPENANTAFEIFLHLVQHKPLGTGGSLDTSTFKPTVEDANDVGEYESAPEGVVYQSTRSPSVFSRDGGKTWYDLDDDAWAYPAGCTPSKSADIKKEKTHG